MDTKNPKTPSTMSKIRDFIYNPPKLHPIIWLAIVALITVYVADWFLILVAVYYILFHTTIKD